MEENNELTVAIEKIVNKAIDKAINRTLAFLRSNGGTHNFESWAEFENRYREWMKEPADNPSHPARTAILNKPLPVHEEVSDSKPSDKGNFGDFLPPSDF